MRYPSYPFRTHMKTRMFPFITSTSSPVKGCSHHCQYCWFVSLATGRLKRYYRNGIAPRVVQGELDRRFKKGEFVFISDMGDLFCNAVPTEWIANVCDAIRESPEAEFLFMTKNPQRYMGIASAIPNNVVLGATIESDRDYIALSKAPNQSDRLTAMRQLIGTLPTRRFVSIEPILDFNLDPFVEQLSKIKPWAVAVGYDNWKHKLPEPSQERTNALISALETFTTVYKKTIRRAWWEP